MRHLKTKVLWIFLRFGLVAHLTLANARNLPGFSGRHLDPFATRRPAGAANYSAHGLRLLGCWTGLIVDARSDSHACLNDVLKIGNRLQLGCGLGDNAVE